MGRQRSIDRDKVLDTAEEIVATRGAAGLTIDAVAKAMGISKGGAVLFRQQRRPYRCHVRSLGQCLRDVVHGDRRRRAFAADRRAGAYAGHPQFGSDFQRQGRRVDGNADSNAGASGEHARMVSQPHRRFGFDDRRRQARARRFSPPKAPLCCVTLV